MNVTELRFPHSNTHTDLWPVVASSGLAQVHHQAQFFLLLLHCLHEVTRRTALLRVKVLIAALRGKNVQQQAFNAGALRRVDGRRRSVLQNLPKISPSNRKTQATTKGRLQSINKQARKDPQTQGNGGVSLQTCKFWELLQSTEDVLGSSTLNEPPLPAPVVLCNLCLGVHLSRMGLKQSPSKKRSGHCLQAESGMDADGPWGAAKGQLCAKGAAER